MPRYSSKRRSHRSRGFTLVELLTVILIVSILMTVGAPIYLNSLDDSRKKICRTNMQTISNAMMAARVKNETNDFGALIAGGIMTTNLPDLTSIPICPNGGTYTLTIGNTGTNSSFQVRCSATYPLTHGRFEPGVDYK